MKIQLHFASYSTLDVKVNQVISFHMTSYCTALYYIIWCSIITYHIAQYLFCTYIYNAKYSTVYSHFTYCNMYIGLMHTLLDMIYQMLCIEHYISCSIYYIVNISSIVNYMLRSIHSILFIIENIKNIFYAMYNFVVLCLLCVFLHILYIMIACIILYNALDV